MDDMNQTQEPPTGATGAPGTGEHPDHSSDQRDDVGAQGPRVSREQVFDIERLRRSSTDKYLAGVSGGLGRHLDIDPLIVRVVFAVTSLFGVGILLYGALWLLLPEEDGPAPVDTTPETRKVLVILAAALAAAMLVGAIFGDGWGFFPIALLALGGVAVYAAVRNKEPRPAQPHPGQYDPDYYRPNAPTSDLTSNLTGDAGGPDAPRPWSYTPPSPRRPRRTGPILFWPTMAVLAIALGSLAMYDLDNPVVEGAYAALSIGIVGVALIIGAFFGRAGGLVLVGLLALPALLVTSTVGNDFTRSSGQVTERPAQASQVQDAYDVRSGQLRLDLTGLAPAELDRLDGRVIHIDLSAGEVVVTLPEGVGYDIDAELRLAGEVRILNRSSSGLNPALNDVTSAARAGEPTISLDINGAVGRVEVNQEGVVR